MYPEKHWMLWVFIMSNIEFGQLFTIVGISNWTQFLVKACLPVEWCILCLIRVSWSWVLVFGWNGRDCK